MPMTPAQHESLQNICSRYGVQFDPADYFVSSMGAPFSPGYAEGWVGGREHGEGGGRKKTIYIGVDTEGRINS